MKKPSLYVDTSVFSHLFADDAPDKMTDTRELWKDFVDEKYQIFVSDVVFEELKKCPEPKRGQIFDEMRRISFRGLPGTDEVTELAKEYVNGGVLSEKHFNDCLHIAFAVVYGCDMIISWNFKHLVNYKTINGVKTINAINRYGEIGIYSPTMLLQEDDL